MYLSHAMASTVLPSEMLRNRTFKEPNKKETVHQKLPLKYGYDWNKLEI